MLHRKQSLNDLFLSSHNDRQTTTTQQQHRRASLSIHPLMNKIKPFFNGSRNDSVPDYYNRVAHIRESCKIFADVSKSHKDFVNKTLENEFAKSYQDFRKSEPSRIGHVSPTFLDRPSILRSTIDEMTQIQESIEEKRKDWFDKCRSLAENAKEKQNAIREILSNYQNEYEKATKKYESAEASYRKFESRDSSTVQNYEARLSELKDVLNSSEQSRNAAYDAYTTEISRFANEEHSITQDYFLEFLHVQQEFYKEVNQLLSEEIPNVEQRLDNDKYAPSFSCDLAKHCLKRTKRSIAYPIETCVRLLEDSVKDEGLFRIGSSQVKQKKFIAQLDLQTIDSKVQLTDLGIDGYVVANALKQYLRELPDSLLTNALLSQWMQMTSLSTEEERLQRTRELLTQLPKVNYDNLCYLIRFLNRVVEHSSENKMTASNLGTCVGHSLLCLKEQPSLSSFTNNSMVLELMIIHCKQLFTEHTQSDSNIIKTPRSSTENLENTQSNEITQPSPKLSTKHRAAPLPPPQRQLLVQIEPSNTNETSTKSGLNSPTTSEKERRFGHVKRNSITDRSTTRPRISSTKKDPDNSNSEIPTSNMNSDQTNVIPSSPHCDTLPSSPEITQF